MCAMFPIDGNAGESYERNRAPAALAGRSPDLAVQLAFLWWDRGHHHRGSAGGAIFTPPLSRRTSHRGCAGAVLDDLIVAGVALRLRSLSALRSALDHTHL